jgi:zinc protease
VKRLIPPAAAPAARDTSAPSPGLGPPLPLAAALSEEEPEPPGLLASDAERVVLPNGLTVLVKEVYPTSVVSLSLWVGVGSVHEPDPAAGISHFVEHMLFKGTEKRPVGRLAQEVHELGGYLNGFTSYECTCYWIVLPSRHFATALEIASDALLHPLFDDQECRREAQVILEEMRMYQDRPDYYCFEKLMALAFPRHRYGRPIIGTEEVVGRLSPEELRAHYRRYYRPNNMAVVVVGDIEAGEALRQVEQALGGIEPGPVERSRSEPEEPQTGMRRLDLEGDLSNAHLQAGFHISDLFSEEAYAYDLLSSILGEGRSSRLNQALRERLGLVTSISCSAFLEKDPGLLVVEAVLPPDHLAPAEEALLAELEAVAVGGVSERELQKAKNMVEAHYVMGQETVEGQGRKLGYYEMLGDYTLAQTYVSRLARVSCDDVAAAAARALRRDNCSLVTCRPRRG